MMHGREKSDPVVVAGKRANKAERSAAEPVERRAGAEGNAGQQSTRRAQNRESVSQALARIRQASKSVSPSHTRGGSRMRESRTYGSVRGALSNGRPYRDPEILLAGVRHSQEVEVLAFGQLERSVPHSPMSFSASEGPKP